MTLYCIYSFMGNTVWTYIIKRSLLPRHSVKMHKVTVSTYYSSNSFGIKVRLYWTCHFVF